MALGLSLRSKLLLPVLAVFILCIAAIGWLADLTLAREIDSGQERFYTERLDNVINTANRRWQRLQDTRMVATYRDQFASTLVDSLLADYASSGEGVQLFIIDQRDGRSLGRFDPSRLPEIPVLLQENHRIPGPHDRDYFAQDVGDDWVVAAPLHRWDWLVGFAVPEEDKIRSLTTFRRYFAIIIASSLMVATVILVALASWTTRPLIVLTRAASAIAAGDYQQDCRSARSDEIGQLANNLDTMRESIRTHVAALERERDRLERAEEELRFANEQLEDRVRERTSELSRANLSLRDEVQERIQIQEQMEDMHRQLLAASREIGMAEVATSVLHNVGNLLNSINVSAQEIARRGSEMKIDELVRAAGLLVDGPANGVEADKIDLARRYLETGCRMLGEDRQTMLDEARTLQERIDMVRDVIKSQQRMAKSGGMNERIDVHAFCDEIMQMARSGLSKRDILVEIDPPAESCMVETDRGKLMQIMVNLIANAEHALEQAPHPRRLTIGLCLDDKDAGTLAITVADNGCGIAPEHLDRLFEYGFTTRKEGHGFGLHGAALMAQSMGGSLTAESAGPGQGARFTLTLPKDDHA